MSYNLKGFLQCSVKIDCERQGGSRASMAVVSRRDSDGQDTGDSTGSGQQWSALGVEHA